MLLIAVGIILSTLGCVEKPDPEVEMVLSDYPKLFEKDVIIVIGENATQIEREGAQAIAENLGNLNGNLPVIKPDVEITESEKAGYNLILMGRPNSNRVLKDIYQKTNITKVTEEHLGVGKGMLEILRSPWNIDRVILIISGSDDWGVKAGYEKLNDLQGINKSNLIVNWGNFTLPEKALLVDIVGGSIGITKQDLIKDYSNVTEKAGNTIKLYEKKVGTDEINREEFYTIFKHESLPGYYVFAISAGQTLGDPIGVIEIGYIRMKEVNDLKTLEIKYKSNKPFKINTLYTRSPEFKELSGGLYPFPRQVFYAYPIDTSLTGSDFSISANDADSSWHIASFDLKSSFWDAVEMIDAAQNFLEKLDESWRYNESETMFVWDKNKISEQSANKILGLYNKSNYLPSIRNLNYGESKLESTRIAPILHQRITVVTKENKKITGLISISVIGNKGENYND